MGNDNKGGFTLEEILREQREKRETVDIDPEATEQDMQETSRLEKQGQKPTEGQNRPGQQGKRPPEGQNRPAQQGQKPTQGQSRPVQQGQRPPEGQNRPVQQGQRPPEGQNRPAQQGQRPTEGQRRPAQQGQRPPEGQNRPAQQGQRPAEGQNRPRKPGQIPPQTQFDDGPMEDINSYATGNIQLPKGRGSYEDRDSYSHENGPLEEEFSENPKGKKKKKKGFGLFGRKKKVPDYVDSDDFYYGIQIKPLDEYRKGYNSPTGEFSMDETYTDLFESSRNSIDNEVEENFLRLQKERRSRVAAAVQSAGMDKESLEDELGVVAPMPLTSFSADPYTKQHGIEDQSRGDVSKFQKAQMDTMKRPQESVAVKLDVESNTMTLKRAQDIPLDRDDHDISQDTVGRILQASPAGADEADAPAQETRRQAPKGQPQGRVNREGQAPAQQAPRQQGPGQQAPGRQAENPGNQGGAPGQQRPPRQTPEGQTAERQAANPPPTGQDGRRPQKGEAPMQNTAKNAASKGMPAQGQAAKGQAAQGTAPQTAGSPQGAKPSQGTGKPQKPGQKPTQETAPGKGNSSEKRAQPTMSEEDAQTSNKSGGDTVIESREPQMVPQISSIYEYRSRGIPAHIINADVLQRALLTEASNLAANAQAGNRKPRRAPKPAKLPPPEAAWEDIESGTSAVQDYSPEDENPGSIDDFNSMEDAASISAELKGDMRDISLRMMITGACTVVLTLINLIFGGTFQSKAELGSAPVIYIILTLLFLGASVAVCYRTIGNGLKALLTFNANSDSGVAVAAAGALLQTISALFYTNAIVEGSQHLYAVVLTAVLFVNAVGKLTMLRRIHSNFRFVTSREQKYAVRMYEDHNTALQMAQDVVAEQPLVAYQRKTNFLKRFLELSYQPDPAETSSQMIAPIALISSLLLCIISMLVTKSVPSAISALTAALIAGVAAVNMLAVNLPMSRLAKVARRAGAMLVGYEAVQEFGNTNAIIVDAADLFPTGTVVLNGIKTYGPRGQIEEAVLAASALVSQVGGPLTGVFEQVINENEDDLPTVETADYEDGYGISGYVEGKRIFLGSRELLVRHKIEPPARADETEYSAANRQMVYIAVDDKPVAMMVLTYTADRRRKNELQRMEDSGISLVIRATDPNITKNLIARLFGIDGNSVKVLTGKISEEYRNLVKTEAPRSDAVLATKGRIESMISVISACIQNKSGVNLIVALQTAAAVLGFILVAFLACFGAISRLNAFGLFLFELAWLLVILLIPKLRK